ncbi:Competence protein F homolog, phosphoribosyltransferase domain; protein YhgH required for utilization of DNA as sole source of carbon and energy [Alloactinosynnema sp. L-07]|uniref:ComF family protein n=1 Tax=Alloactinosynnema sp. L-07 TaxID=1653480 RepID=UPI00065EF7C9|nr:ComF family protein [Alloactinosynnema sp. L-07]CRK59706.1 Competence protein F homolog, phosphoribosyltransferase domain; protein YhgH required for utilization of DNA as sole source of carbon and energy [Alloactinosynnema sp. L-07]
MLNALLDLLLPRFCAGCRTQGTRWCTPCTDATDGLFTVRRAALEKRPPAHALAPYNGPARRFVIAYKDGRRELAPIMGAHFAKALLRLETRDVTMVPAPSRWSAARKRGGNHIARAAEHTAKALTNHQITAQVVPALKMAWRTRDSAGLNPIQRAANLHGALTVVRKPPPGTPVVLLDDVITTGATMAACIDALAAAGIPVAAAVSFTATI